MIVEGPPTADEMVHDVWRLILTLNPARALVLVRVLRAWFITSDNEQRGKDSVAAYYRSFLQGVELTLEATVEAKRMRAKPRNKSEGSARKARSS